MNKEDKISSFFEMDIPSKVPPSQRQALVSDFNKIPIVTDSISIEDGFYFIEPTLNDILKLKAKLVENEPDIQDGIAYSLILQYIIKNMTNIDFDNGNISLNLLAEVETFIREKIIHGFFYLEVLRSTQLKKQTTDMTGTTEELV